MIRYLILTVRIAFARIRYQSVRDQHGAWDSRTHMAAWRLAHLLNSRRILTRRWP